MFNVNKILGYGSEKYRHFKVFSTAIVYANHLYFCSKTNFVNLEMTRNRALFYALKKPEHYHTLSLMSSSFAYLTGMNEGSLSQRYTKFKKSYSMFFSCFFSKEIQKCKTYLKGKFQKFYLFTDRTMPLTNSKF